ncbi:MAG TPA: hypothetical protein VLW54_01035 [Candidatus Acidoferrales bacterium]|nr:hypothetical protein [Candidatus Acidoferrales bacterium]
MASGSYFHVDLILAALIGPAGDPIEELISLAQESEGSWLILEDALYYAFCSVESRDRLDLARFCGLLKAARIVPSPRPFEAPTLEEIARWREAALGSG